MLIMMGNKMIANNSYWVGKVDDRKVPFHRLTLEKGTTYNSYFLNTDKPTIIDTVDIMFGGEFVKHLESITNLEKIHYIVINHVEPDHAGGLPALINKSKNATIVTTEKGKELLLGMFKLQDKKFLVVKDGDTLDIGGKTLKFIETPYLHTEETMITYCVEDKILYPCDIFSTHIANTELFNDLSEADITQDFIVYYQLIMHPHRPFVRDMIEKIKDLEINMIAPSHGYILRDNVGRYIDLYDEMSKTKKANKKALILFSSMTGNTSKVAQSISCGLEDMGVETDVINVKNADVDSIISLVQQTDAILIGSSTKYADMIGNIENIIKEILKQDLNGKIGASFGSFGWSGEAIEIINDYIRQSKMTLVDTSYLIKTTGTEGINFPLRVKFSPDDSSKEVCLRAGRIIGEILINN
jgi:flavorubredoxin